MFIRTTLFRLIALSLFSISLSCPPGNWSQSTAVPSRCYFLVTNPTSWFAAEGYCRSLVPNAHLVSIGSAFENSNVQAILENANSVHHLDQFWIGGDDLDVKGQYQWTDKKPFSYQKWDAGEPKPINDCVALQIRDNGNWKSEDCGESYGFLCAV